jgi:hypothetical protein
MALRFYADRTTVAVATAGARALALLVLTVFVSACGARPTSPDDRPLLRDDVAWVRDYVSWIEVLDRNLGAVQRFRLAKLGGRDVTDARHVEAIERLETCGPTFDAEVQLPLRQSLRKAAALIRQACREWVRGERAYYRAFTVNPGDELEIASAAEVHGNELAYRAARQFDLAFAWARPLPRLSGRVAQSRIEPRLGRAAATITHRAVEVRCWSDADWTRVRTEFKAYGGIVDVSGFMSDFDKGHISLAPFVCDELAALLYGPAREQRRVDADRAWAIGTLAHEAEHVVSPGTEAETECYAQQDVLALSRFLGVPAAEARRIAVVSWRENYPPLPREYRTRRCRDGAELGRHPESAVWP